MGGHSHTEYLVWVEPWECLKIYGGESAAQIGAHLRQRVQDEPAGTRFHDLRHTYASALIASGCSVKAVQANLGHKSAAMTLDIYSHLWPQDDDPARDAVQMFFDSGVSAVCHDEAIG